MRWTDLATLVMLGCIAGLLFLALPTVRQGELCWRIKPLAPAHIGGLYCVSATKR